MLIHDQIYSWKGWGGRLHLGSGKCWLKIFDLRKDVSKGVAHLRPVIVVVNDIPESNMSVRSCTSHIATNVVAEFNIRPNRMMWIEYYPEQEYGAKQLRLIPEKFDLVEFKWKDNSAINPAFRPLQSPMLEAIINLLKINSSTLTSS